jgi:hypothetical protein
MALIAPAQLLCAWGHPPSSGAGMGEWGGGRYIPTQPELHGLTYNCNTCHLRPFLPLLCAGI